MVGVEYEDLSLLPYALAPRTGPFNGFPKVTAKELCLFSQSYTL